MGSICKRDRLEMNQVIRFYRIQQLSNHRTERLLPNENRLPLPNLPLINRQETLQNLIIYRD